ncbi:cytochrome-c peroxidase [Lacihabitans sp. LS3-19]|uniref:cytochrome-c peroxidase n=1 Tax=Lacihabitans sp. LS3-19 TaxID=2487335 RepID=UPI0020CF83D1|nr:cytochrome c peroxidase [Lacihabitans sp. LS3-19]MCP9769837.1 cytochrome-c peroxidase [Lacihabitans sp. LS3-19]
MKKLYKYFQILGFSALIISCNNKDNIPTLGGVDKELEDLLVISSKGIGSEFYILPTSTELSKIPQDPKNPLTPAKVELGKFLFHETALGQNPKKEMSFQTYSCASCHHAKAGFQACLPQGIGEGGLGFGSAGEKRVMNTAYKSSEIDVQPLKSPSALNIAYQSNILWNGQFGSKGVNVGTDAKWTAGTPKAVNKMGYEGVETQAIAGRDVHRLIIDRIMMNTIPQYKSMFTQAFGEETLIDENLLKVNGALAIAAYERTLMADQAPFQQWLKGNLNAMTDQEKEGAKVFFGKGDCASCHNGPNLANMEFHALGMGDLKDGSYGNAEVHNIGAVNPELKGRGGFTGNEADFYKFKVPQLYNLKDSPFYGHGSSFTTIEQVLNYKNLGVKENSLVPANKLSEKFKPLNLSQTEIKALEAFIKNALYDGNLNRYVPKKLPSGLAFPNNDRQSKIDLGL